jgi:hypothetical protein
MVASMSVVEIAEFAVKLPGRGLNHRPGAENSEEIGLPKAAWRHGE